MRPTINQMFQTFVTFNNYCITDVALSNHLQRSFPLLSSSVPFNYITELHKMQSQFLS